MRNTLRIFLLSTLLLAAALWGARAHAQSRMQSLEELRSWRQQIQVRQDLEDREKDLRLEFIDRLMFQIERKQGDQDLSTALQPILLEMKETDQLKINQSLGSIGDFLEQLHLSYLNLLEKNEKPLPFLQAFIEFSGISEPANMDEFAATRNYYDGRTVQPASPQDLEEAAEFLEKKETDLGKALPYRLLTQDPASLTFHQNLEF